MNKIILLGFIIFSVSLFAQDFETGKLTEADRNSLSDELLTITGVKIDSTKTIIINFYLKPATDPNGSCIDHYTNDFEYHRFIKKNSNIVQFFVSEQNYRYKKKKVIEDQHNVLKKLLFQNAKDCGNYVIISPNNDFIRKYGEYRQHDIPKFFR